MEFQRGFTECTVGESTHESVRGIFMSLVCEYWKLHSTCIAQVTATIACHCTVGQSALQCATLLCITKYNTQFIIIFRRKIQVQRSKSTGFFMLEGRVKRVDVGVCVWPTLRPNALIDFVVILHKDVLEPNLSWIR